MKITLTKPHTHAGTEHTPGATLELETGQAEWLIKAEVAKAAKPEPKKSNPGE